MTTIGTVRHAHELRFGRHGGAELFFSDLDGDGQVEILAYQGPAVFGASIYRQIPHVAAAFPQSTCLSAFRRDGTPLWHYGQPNPDERPYICHAHESCVAAGDVDGEVQPASFEIPPAAATPAVIGPGSSEPGFTSP